MLVELFFMRTKYIQNLTCVQRSDQLNKTIAKEENFIK
jgi:hypothetical protein